MGGVLSSVLGTTNQFQPTANAAGNPYAQAQLQQDIERQNQIYAQQQALGQQLQQQALGKGPNPAQLQYQQNVAQNIAQAQGLIGSQRGLNPALAAKLGANAAAQANQQAAGQAGVLGAEQQLAAQQQLAGLYGQQQQGNIAQQGLYTGAQQGALGIGAGIGAGNQQQAGNIVSGLTGNIGALMGLKKADGGMIDHYAEGGETGLQKSLKGMSESMSSKNAQAMPHLLSSGIDYALQNAPKPGAYPMIPSGYQGYADGGMTDPASIGNPLVPAPIMSSVKRFIDAASGPAKPVGPTQAPQTKAMGGPINFKPGGRVPGHASVKGDSLKNDTVPALVSPGEIVIPRSITQSADASKKAAAFVAAVLARHSMGKKK